jgi:branched-chain amino acid transport system ATP-binding protein
MAPLLHVDGVCRNFGALRAVDGLSFEVGEGEALGILGPNGAGKSTLFNLISGDIRPSAGAIRLRGREITHLPSYKRCRMGIGRSYQIPQPFGRMTVFENVLAAASFSSGRGESPCYDLCIDVLDRTGLLDKCNSAAHTLTLLERKRLELARALATKPVLLLLDEIAGGLTDGECHELIEVINVVRSSGVSIIWIEHVVHVLLATVDWLLVINFGKYLAEGEPHTVMANVAVQEVYMGIEVE